MGRFEKGVQACSGDLEDVRGAEWRRFVVVIMVRKMVGWGGDEEGGMLGWAMMDRPTGVDEQTHQGRETLIISQPAASLVTPPPMFLILHLSRFRVRWSSCD